MGEAVIHMGKHLNDRVMYGGKSGRHTGLHLNDRVGYKGEIWETHGVTS